MCSARNIKLMNIETEFGIVTARDNWVISQILYKWIKSGGKEFSCTRIELAAYAMCSPQHITVILRKYHALFHRRYVHTGRGESRRTHLHIDVNLLELCITFGERIYDAVTRSLSSFLRDRMKAIFSVLARTFHSSKKTSEDVLNTNNLGDVPVSDSESPDLMSMPANREVVEMENDFKTMKSEDEIRAFAPALCDERASAISNTVVTPSKRVILKHNRPYTDVLSALKDRERHRIAPNTTLERIKNIVSGNKSPIDDKGAADESSVKVHPLRMLLNKRLRSY